MLKYTRNSVIAFDFKDALSFEGETGPYMQYAVVRTRSIFRKAETTAERALAGWRASMRRRIWPAKTADGIWEVWLRAAKTSLLLEQCIATAEPAYLAKHAFQLAQDFSNFYHRHHILTEADPARKKLLLATAAVAQRELIRSLGGWGSLLPPSCDGESRAQGTGNRERNAENRAQTRLMMRERYADSDDRGVESWR